jgi:diguanylate cyclase (GGDEF)-like protein
MDNDNATLVAGGRDILISELKKASDSPACLIVVRGTQQGKRYELASASLSLGRDDTSDIVIDDPKVSRKQAQIEIDGSSVHLIDGGSRNGTYHNDRKVLAGESVCLNKEDMIKVGDTILKYLPKGELEIHYIGMLESRAHTDAMTKTYNKGYILEAMAAEFKRARGLGHDFSLLVFDLDHFKRVNDTHGHDAGDKVLIEIAGILKMAVNANKGILGRFGGEEFVALLPEQNIDGAIELAESIRATIEAHVIRYEGKIIRMTASIGAASIAADIEEANELFKRADKAVYLAKESGRNRVCRMPI